VTGGLRLEQGGSAPLTLTTVFIHTEDSRPTSQLDVHTLDYNASATDPLQNHYTGITTENEIMFKHG